MYSHVFACDTRVKIEPPRLLPSRECVKRAQGNNGFSEFTSCVYLNIIDLKYTRDAEVTRARVRAQIIYNFVCSAALITMPR